jgi:aspartyl-tRNA(Asn)/glutamyl-tRNA(Gln) amidotransferase subunit C
MLFIKNPFVLIFYMKEVKIDEDLVKKVAKNARLELTEEEVKKFTPQLKEVILKSFNKLDEVSVEEEASFQPIEQKNKFRSDNPNKPLTQEKALSNISSELKKDGYIKGPKTM